jgi:enoyl-CoA hydratase/carnithine racemase
MLFCAADLRLAVDEERSRYGLPEVTQGIPVIGPTAAICAAAIPPAQHASLVMHGKRLSAAVAHARGIVHELLPDAAALEVRACERAAALRVDLAAYAATKRALRAPLVAAATAAMQALGEALPGGNPFRQRT